MNKFFGLFLSGYKKNIIIAAAFALLSLQAFADEKFTKKGADEKMQIRSDRIEVEKNSQKINFIGNVIAIKGEDSILANKMVLFYTKDKSSSNKTAIKEIIATEKVRVFSVDIVATANKATYKPSIDSVTLENNVIVNRGSSVGRGEKFVYNFKTGMGNFVGAQKTKAALPTALPDTQEDNRVTVIIGNDEKKKK